MLVPAMAKLSILVPVYNEAATIASVMDMLASKLPDAEIIYIDDGSKDDSFKIIQSKIRRGDMVLSKLNGGKGSAIRLGLQHAKGDFAVIQDADLEYDPGEISLLLEAATKNLNCVVFGSRFLQKNPNIYPLYLLGNKVLTCILNILFCGKLTDSYTCYKLFPLSLMRRLPLTARGFELEAELAALPLKHGYTIIEVPVSYKPRTFEEGKKINWKDAVRGIVTMLRIRFTSTPLTHL